MNINLLSPSFLPKSLQKRENSHYSNPVMPSNLSGLKADTVSFTGSGAKMIELYQAQLETMIPNRMNRISTVFLDVLESVSSSLKEMGFSLSRKYCEMSPVKSSESSISKIKRSKTLKIPDAIRATIFCNDPYDLSKLNALLAEMKQRGYVLATAEMPLKDLIKRGYLPTEEVSMLVNYFKKPNNANIKALISKFKEKDYNLHDIQSMIERLQKFGHTPSQDEILAELNIVRKSVPDIDIRLKDIKSQQSKLAPELAYSIGKPQKSHYEDIQMRFVRDYDKNKMPVQHELIVLFGKNYAAAKHFESEKVYSFLRQFGELKITKYFENERYARLTKRPRDFIDLIQELFRSNVSKKEFLNAKNKDYRAITDETEIKFSNQDKILFKNYFEDLITGVNDFYNTLISKSSAIRKAKLEKELEQDLKTINGIQEGLTETVKFYNSGARAKAQLF
ncbi:hypothetical protein IJ541_05305 [bacterium]|nr:hypothetical protein [bacterium]